MDDQTPKEEDHGVQEGGDGGILEVDHVQTQTEDGDDRGHARVRKNPQPRHLLGMAAVVAVVVEEEEVVEVVVAAEVEVQRAPCLVQYPLLSSRSEKSPLPTYQQFRLPSSKQFEHRHFGIQVYGYGDGQSVK